jgi:hypothetical protein
MDARRQGIAPPRVASMLEAGTANQYSLVLVETPVPSQIPAVGH